ncbi:MAG TPA: winged helix-turn-helix domain-containing protein [Micromonosporaceae bacterium]|nr:winged helix-turn-helix domain-containing protein [Micromonosporaceae bacterium]
MADLVRRLFGVGYTLRGVSYLLHRIGWSCQVPVHRAVERDEEAITTWVRETWPAVKSPRRPLAPGCALRMSPASR